jgi:hypothetical protein
MPISLDSCPETPLIGCGVLGKHSEGHGFIAGLRLRLFAVMLVLRIASQQTSVVSSMVR